MRDLDDSTPVLHDTGKLVTRMDDAGYLFFRGLLPEHTVRSLHRTLALYVQQCGWLSPDHAAEESVANPGVFSVDPDSDYLAVIEGFNRLVEYNALSHHRAILDVLQRLLNDRILVHPKPLPRNIFPNVAEFTTPAHQDFPNIQGTEDVITAWIPLMECTEEVGGLQVAAGSHGGGVYDFGIGNGAGGIEILQPFDGQWVGGPTRPGDVLFFHSMAVHKGIPNRSDKLRMSIDARYQRASDPFNPMNIDRPYGLPDTWEALYATWPATDAARELQYYWERFELDLKPFDPRWFDRRDEIGFELGENRDPRARSVLMRIVMRDADPTKRARAQTLLDALPPSA
jgi:ectoine hydroxylase-related dioxygenase (phytanoyl-CoA dioxygenase family)